jgi:galactose-1-phosphate uridylyltransferase
MGDVQQDATIQYSSYSYYYFDLRPLASSHSELICNYKTYRQLVGIL